MSERNRVTVIRKSRNSTITLEFPLLLSEPSRQLIGTYLSDHYGQELLSFDFGTAGEKLHLLIRRNQRSFQTMDEYARRVKTAAESVDT